MYVPPAFREDRPQAIHALIEAHPLALLVSTGEDGPTANPVPMLLDPSADVLRCHLARANGQIGELRAAQAAGREVLAVFQGPQAYISPGWYASKAEHGRVVPTWNYLIVQVRGVPRVIDDADWLRGQVGALTDRHEAGLADPWSVGDAPDGFVAAQLRGIVGLELPLTRVTGKWKASQNRPAADRAGVIAGLEAAGDAMAARIPAPEQSQ
ncbi:FMN-binding negative transcriptional regulator [Paracoccus sphaerophysae]|uniref:Transcriptional regulator n=1 Tax=Paracoccus sphaerophysae TaxID=690417 RepID=A0A099ETV7_9RHOB|nr:FMN-binding negative transcriptional regulator [Paracoccus sphaerophysae]KGJ01704.1 transcriptional regulator [Paracoccus sphaerophysae]